MSAGLVRADSAIAVNAGGLRGVPAAAAIMIPGVLLTAALLQLTAMLRIVETGNFFASGDRLRSFAFYLFLAVLAGIVCPPLLALLTEQRAAVTVSSGEVLMLLVTGLLFFVARLLAEAQNLAHEHSQIV